MKITEYIAALEAIMAEHGDLEVELSRFDGDRVEAYDPWIDYRAVLRGREHKPSFASRFKYDKDFDGRNGEKVCRIA